MKRGDPKKKIPAMKGGVIPVDESGVQEALSLLHATLESTADGILVVDRTGKITHYNTNYVNMWKIPDAVLRSGERSAILDFMRRRQARPEGFQASVRAMTDQPENESFDLLKLADGRVFEAYSKPQQIGGVVVGRVWSFRDITDRRQAEENLLSSLRDKEVMMREIHHRVKNNLQIVYGLLDMTRKRAHDPVTSGILMDIMMKIATMSQIHTRLYESKQFNRIDMNTQFHDQITALAHVYASEGTDIVATITSRTIYLTIDQAIPCALLVNEILTNAYKHAFRGRKHGSIEISAHEENGHMKICVRDDGIGIGSDYDPEQAQSLGFKLIRALLQYQLKGSLMINSGNGTEVLVSFPLQNVSV